MGDGKMDRRVHRANHGFTLIEVMIVLAIIAILAAVAYPSYQDQIRTARRSDAMDALLTLQSQQEKWRANNTTFGTLANIGGSANSVDGRYTLVVAGNSATAYTLTANAVGDQTNDTGCTAMTLTISAANPRGVKAPATCWRN
jgi:type IV pilus assembly protein PilE